MLLSLPVELIQRVVSLSTPEEITSITYQPRQDSLRALCLVHSLLHDIAQPVLDEALRVSDKTDYQETVLPYTQGSARHLRYLWIKRVGVVPWADLRIPSSVLAFVREFRLCDVDQLDVSILAAMPALVRLSLYYVKLLEQHTPSTLFHVTELTCDTVSTSGSDKTSFLSPSTFPALQFLAYYNGGSDDCAISTTLYQQLFCVVDIDAEAPFRPLLDSLSEKCLPFVNVNFRSLSSAAANLHRYVHCRLRNTWESPGGNSVPGFQRLAAAIAGVDSSILRLRRLSLPPDFLAVIKSEYEEVATAAAAVLDAASAKGIEVVYEDGEEEYGGSFLSFDTIEYARKLRTEQEQTERDAKGGRQ